MQNLDTYCNGSRDVKSCFQAGANQNQIRFAIAQVRKYLIFSRRGFSMFLSR